MRTRNVAHKRYRAASHSPPLPSPSPSQSQLDALGGEVEEEGQEEEEEPEERNMNPEEEEQEQEQEQEQEEDIKGDEGISIEDPKVLDCCICHGPLRPPILQCKHGHSTCGTCFATLLDRCQHCTSATAEVIRNLALEKVLEAAKVFCPNKHFGCNLRIPYYQESQHKRSCLFSPCFCPAGLCPFKGSALAILDHVLDAHNWPIHRFKYNEACRISISFYDQFKVLVSESDRMFLLSIKSGELGTALSVVCVGPPGVGGKEYWYELTPEPDDSWGNSSSRKRARGARFAAPMLMSTLEEGIGDNETFLLVSDKMLYPTATNLTVNVFISRQPI
ncbi:hypothetical protein LUZ60_009398 [Juncus effusus]|nr:hypothetical protein LUZ60_009398 [Juncus effusus]